MDMDQLVEEAVEEAAASLSAVFPRPEQVREKDLAQALKQAFEALGGPVELNRKYPIPGWRPQPGNVDLVVYRRRRSREPWAFAELKWSYSDANPKIYEARWDMFKMASTISSLARGVPELRRLEGVYLIVGASYDQWFIPDKLVQWPPPVTPGVELFPEFPGYRRSRLQESSAATPAASPLSRPARPAIHMRSGSSLRSWA